MIKEETSINYFTCFGHKFLEKAVKKFNDEKQAEMVGTFVACANFLRRIIISSVRMSWHINELRSATKGLSCARWSHRT